MAASDDDLRTILDRFAKKAKQGAERQWPGRSHASSVDMPAVRASIRKAVVDAEVEKQLAAQTAADRLLRVKEVAKLTGLSRATIYRLERAGTFPKRVQTSANAVAWHEREVVAWKSSRPRSR